MLPSPESPRRPMSPTYLGACANVVQKYGALEPQLQLAQTQASIQNLLGDLAHCTPHNGPGFVSGVAPDGAPVEMSITLDGVSRLSSSNKGSSTNSGITAVRLLAQEWKNTDESFSHFRAKVESLAPKLGGTDAAELRPWLQAIADCGADTTKSYLGWLGAEFRHSGPTALKLYLNPWACLDLEPHQMIAMSLGLLPNIHPIPEELTDAIARMPLAAPHIVGINISRGRIETKLYFILRLADLATLTPFVRDFGTPLLQKSWEHLVQKANIQARPTYELHLALRLGNPTLGLKINPYVPDFFPDDESAFHYLENGFEALGLDRENLVAGRHLIEAQRTFPGRQLQFIGLGESKFDLYFRPW